MAPVGFEPTISAGERPQTYALDGAATGTGCHIYIYTYIYILYTVFNILSLLLYNILIMSLSSYYTPNSLFTF